METIKRRIFEQRRRTIERRGVNPERTLLRGGEHGTFE